MPQSERSQIIKGMLSWIDAKTKSRDGVRKMEIIRHCELQVTSLGATTKACEKYLAALVRHKLVEIKGSKYVCTQTGKNWLEKKVS